MVAAFNNQIGHHGNTYHKIRSGDKKNTEIYPSHRRHGGPWCTDHIFLHHGFVFPWQPKILIVDPEPHVRYLFFLVSPFDFEVDLFIPRLFHSHFIMDSIYGDLSITIFLFLFSTLHFNFLES